MYVQGTVHFKSEKLLRVFPILESKYTALASRFFMFLSKRYLTFGFSIVEAKEKWKNK